MWMTLWGLILTAGFSNFEFLNISFVMKHMKHKHVGLQLTHREPVSLLYAVDRLKPTCAGNEV